MMQVPSDTSPDAARKQIELLRAATPARRLQLTCALSGQVFAWAWDALQRAQPRLDDRSRRIRFAEIHYGPAVADLVRRHIDA